MIHVVETLASAAAAKIAGWLFAPRASNKIAETAVIRALALRASNTVEELALVGATDIAEMAVLRVLVLLRLKCKR